MVKTIIVIPKRLIEPTEIVGKRTPNVAYITPNAMSSFYTHTHSSVGTFTKVFVFSKQHGENRCRNIEAKPLQDLKAIHVLPRVCLLAAISCFPCCIVQLRLINASPFFVVLSCFFFMYRTTSSGIASFLDWRLVPSSNSWFFGSSTTSTGAMWFLLLRVARWGIQLIFVSTWRLVSAQRSEISITTHDQKWYHYYHTQDDQGIIPPFPIGSHTTVRNNEYCQILIILIFVVLLPPTPSTGSNQTWIFVDTEYHPPPLLSDLWGVAHSTAKFWRYYSRSTESFTPTIYYAKLSHLRRSFAVEVWHPSITRRNGSFVSAGTHAGFVGFETLPLNLRRMYY